MNCAFDKEKLSGYYDGELDAAEKAEVERHIASCSECLRELGELKSAALLIKELPRLRAPRSIADGVSREIQAAGKVHRFAAVRRNLMWAAAVAAAVLVVLNVAYFSRSDSKEADTTMAAKARPVSVLAEAPVPSSVAPRNGSEELRRVDESVSRRSMDRSAEQKPVVAQPELRKNLTEGKRDDFERGEKAAREPAAPADAAKASPAPEKPASLPPGTPAPKPEAAPVLAAKEEPRPVPAVADKEKAVEAKKDADGLGKADADVKAKKPAPSDPAGDAPAHFTLASTQMTKAHQQLDDTLRRLGVALPAAKVGAMKAPASPSENAYTLEMTDSQLAKLREEIGKQNYSRLLAAAPGDQVLAQYGDAGLFRGREKPAVASGGAPAPPPAPAKRPKDDAKEAEDAQTVPQAAAKAGADKLEKTAEPRRKVVIHLLEVLAFPDAQPAGDPVKK